MVAQVDEVLDFGEAKLEVVLLRRDSAIDKFADDIGGLVYVYRRLIDGLI